MRKVVTARRPPVGGRPGTLRLGLHLSRGMRVGLYGGSFNPPHEGHLHVARTALRRLGLDKVIWLVSPQNPLKPAAGTPRLRRRVNWTRRVAHGPAMIVSNAERRLGSRFTIDTVRLLKARFPAVRFVLIVGSDSLAGLNAWRDWQRLLREIPLAVVARPGVTIASLGSPAARRFAPARLPAGAGLRLATARPPAWIYLTARWNPASSTALRK